MFTPIAYLAAPPGDAQPTQPTQPQLLLYETRVPCGARRYHTALGGDGGRMRPVTLLDGDAGDAARDGWLAIVSDGGTPRMLVVRMPRLSDYSSAAPPVGRLLAAGVPLSAILHK